MTSIIRFILKSAFLWLCVTCYIAAATVVYVFSHGRIARSKNLTATASGFSSLGLKILGIRVTLHGDLPTKPREPVLFVSNHQGYLDVLILLATFPCSFVTAIEWRNTPLVGLIAQLGASIFVARKNRAGLKDEIEAVAERLSWRVPVVLFPEATSSDGTDVLPFKSPMMEAAVVTQSAVQPVYIHYRAIDEEPVSDKNRHRALFYPPMNLILHMIRVPLMRSIDVDIYMLAPIFFDANTTRKRLAQECYRAIRMKAT